ncbi:hypothetical protein Scep_028803 [Stephania cephalantha]|uniref:Uncharacterized protein n=1 Tax=Stephania cephalantha TaxID=152367 RepID=A0AAP0EAM1_9MAGN
MADNNNETIRITIKANTINTTTVPPPATTQTQHSLMPILAKLHAGYFRICLSLCSQALLWHSLSNKSDDMTSRSALPPCLCCFDMIKKEFLHYVGVNYLFAPSTAWLLLLQSSPFSAPHSVCSRVLWWVFALPIVVLDVKIYGQWFTKGKRFLSTVANPTSQLSVIGNLVGARAAAKMGWRECALAMFSLGIAHYFVLFVTLYQRLSGTDRIPAMLRPVFFLFIAAPSMASLAWVSISGTFDTPSKMLFFLSLFLFTSLVSRPTLFKKSMKRFSIAWWAYPFPITVLALASMEYAREVKSSFACGLMLGLFTLSVLISYGLLVFTAFNIGFLLHTNKDDPIFLVIPSSTSSVATTTCVMSQDVVTN